MDWIFEPEDELLDTGVFKADVQGNEVRCPQCDFAYVPPTCEVCGIAWFLPKRQEPLC